MAVSVLTPVQPAISFPTDRTSRNVSSEPLTFTFPGILFDMDGTIIDSTNAVIKFWEGVGTTYGIEAKTILAISHGRRTIEMFQQIDPKNATWEFVQKQEGQIPLKYGSDAVEIPGARRILTQLREAQVPYAIVTSGTRPLVTQWLKILGLEEPRVLVTAEDVEKGKPDPACYLLGKEKLNLPTTQPYLVIEDAPAGIRAGKAAGFHVLALATTHKIEELVEAGADWIVHDLRSIVVKSVEEKSKAITLEIKDIIRL